jgi:hypothetical protein
VSSVLCTHALLRFVWFLIATGRCRSGSDAGIPTIAHCDVAPLPRHLLPDKEIHRLERWRVSSLYSATISAKLLGRRQLPLKSAIWLFEDSVWAHCRTTLSSSTSGSRPPN